MENIFSLLNLQTFAGDTLTTFLLVCLLVIAVAVARSKSVLNIVIISGAFSLLMAAIFTTLQAPDVALTEAVVGAGISALLAMATCVVADIEVCNEKSFSAPAFFAAILVGALLLFATLDMPPYGAIDNPVHQRVVPYYIQYSYPDTHIKNVVTVILAGYRGFDTLGESIVVLIAGLGVLYLLETKKPSSKLIKREGTTPTRVISVLLLPAIILFGFYIQFHGDVGPGGAFQAGVLFAVAAAVYTLVVGYRVASKVFTQERILTLAVLGISLYFAIGIITMFLGGNFLEYGVLLEDGQFAQHVGIFLVELGIACNVTAVLTVIFLAIVSYPRVVQE